MGKTIPNGAKIQLCNDCHKHGYDYEMFRLPDGHIFLVVYMKTKTTS